MVPRFLNIFYWCKVILRLWGIQEARRRRIDREVHEEWLWNNRKYLKKYDRQLDRKIDRYFSIGQTGYLAHPKSFTERHTKPDF